MENAPRALNRSEAALALSSFSTPETLAALLRSAASDKFFGTRLASIGSLSHIATEDIREPMLNFLTDKDLRVRRAAASALGGLRKDDDCVARLLDLARSDSRSVRQYALYAVIRLKPDHLIELLTPFLDMDSPGQRMRPMAMSALAKLGDESIMLKLLDLSHDSNGRVRRTALQTFAYLGKGQQNAVDCLLDSLGDQDKVERLTAIEVLSQQRKDAAAIEPLQHLVNTESMPGVVHAARAALESIRTSKK
jgi:HEAT repeat protein